MSWISNLFNSGAGYKAAQNQLNNYYDQGKSALNPYINAGSNAINPLTDAASALLDPGKLRQSWLDQYKLSPEAKQNQQDATNYGLESASSMGLMGSSPALQAIQGENARIGMQDQNNYLSDLMNKYMQGVGIDQNLYSGGEQAAGQLANLSQNMGTNSANMAYGQTAGPNSMLSSLLGTAGGAAAAGFLGGPTGIAAMLAKHMMSGGGSGGSQVNLPQPANTMSGGY